MIPMPKMNPGNAVPHIETVASGNTIIATDNNPISAKKADNKFQTITSISKSGFFIAILLSANCNYSRVGMR